MTKFMRVNVELIVSLYNSGLSKKAVAKRLGVSDGVVSSRLKQRGIRDRVDTRMSKLDMATLTRLYTQEGKTQKDIADEYSVSPAAVSERINKLGVKRFERPSREEVTELRVKQRMGILRMSKALKIPRPQILPLLIAYRLPTKLPPLGDKHDGLLREYGFRDKFALSGEERRKQERKIVELIKTGRHSREEVAKELGCSLGVVTRVANKKKLKKCFFYRNKRAAARFKEGATISELITEFSMSRKALFQGPLKGVRVPYVRNPEAVWNKEQVCETCGKTFVRESKRKYCAHQCSSNARFLASCETYLDIRRRRRSGESSEAIASEAGLSAKRVEELCSRTNSPTAWSADRLGAIESLRRHSGAKWLSTVAILEIRRAMALLESENLVGPLKREGII